MSRCPICDELAACKGYPYVWGRLRVDPQRWIPVHAILNGLASPIHQARHDAARAAALIAELPPPAHAMRAGRPCGGCP